MRLDITIINILHTAKIRFREIKEEVIQLSHCISTIPTRAGSLGKQCL